MGQLLPPPSYFMILLRIHDEWIVLDGKVPNERGDVIETLRQWSEASALRVFQVMGDRLRDRTPGIIAEVIQGHLDFDFWDDEMPPDFPSYCEDAGRDAWRNRVMLAREDADHVRIELENLR